MSSEGNPDLRALREQIVANQHVIDELNRKISRKTQEVRVIQEIAYEINSTLDLEQILQHILGSMDRVFGFAHAMILLADPATEKLVVAASHGYPQSGVGAEVLPGQGIVGVVARRRKLMRMGAVRHQAAYAATVRAQLERAGMTEGLGTAATLPGLPEAQSQIAIPLLAKDELVGVFSVESPRAGAFDEIDEQLIGLLAAQAASAVSNARLYQAEERRRRELAEAHARLAALNEGLETKIRERTVELEVVNRSLGEALATTRIEQRRSEELLRRTAPPEVIPQMLEGKLAPQRLMATIMFTDLEGFTRHSSALEPDELFAQINDLFDRMGGHVRRYRGYVNKTIGDGLMALFGVPWPTPTHAVDAVLTALAIQEELAAGFALRMRVGINSGTVSAGMLGPADKSLYDVLGDSVNLASRLEKVAPAGGIAISADTCRLIEPYFRLEPMGEQAVKGKGAVACYHLLGLKRLDEDRRRVDEGSEFCRRCPNLSREVASFRQERLAAVDFVSVQARDGALGHNEAVATIALALRRFLVADCNAGALRDGLAAIDERDLIHLALLHDLGKHAIDPRRLNATPLSTAEREKPIHELQHQTAHALERLELGHLVPALERFYRFELTRGAEPESDPLVLVVAAADMYDALTAPKAFRGRSWSIAGTLDELLRSPHAQRQACPVFLALAELMRSPTTVLSARPKAEVLFR